jgi:hypothetical protein
MLSRHSVRKENIAELSREKKKRCCSLSVR